MRREQGAIAPREGKGSCEMDEREGIEKTTKGVVGRLLDAESGAGGGVDGRRVGRRGWVGDGSVLSGSIRKQTWPERQTSTSSVRFFMR